MDRATPHITKKTEAFVASQKRLHVFFLPPRSPELNPDEQVWSHLKNHGLKSHRATTPSELKALTRKKLARTAQDKLKVIGIFHRNDHARLFV
jgi:transposase